MLLFFFVVVVVVVVVVGNNNYYYYNYSIKIFPLPPDSGMKHSQPKANIGVDFAVK